MSNLVFLTQDPREEENVDITQLFNIALSQYKEGDCLLFQVKKNNEGEKILTLKKTEHSTNLNAPAPQLVSNEANFSIFPEDIQTSPADKGKILLSNGVNYVPSTISETNLNSVLVSNANESFSRRKISHLSFLNFSINYTKPSEVVIGLPSISVDLLTSKNAKEGDVLMYKNNKYSPSALGVTCSARINFSNFNTSNWTNIKNIDRSHNLIYVYFNSDTINPNKNIPHITPIGGDFSFFIKEYNSKHCIIEFKDKIPTTGEIYFSIL